MARENLYRVNEELSPVAEEVDEEDWDDEGEEEREEEELNGPERLWRDGEHEPEEDPEAWVDRVADEVEERRLVRETTTSMCMTGERNLIAMELEQQARGGRED